MTQSTWAPGFIINLEKSSFGPSHESKFLGNVIDSIKLETRLPSDKVQKIKNGILKFKSVKRCKIREFARILGLLTSACQAIEYGWLYTKHFEQSIEYDNFVTIPETLIPIFDWWLQAIHSSCKIKTDEYALEIFTDASTTGWGAACGTDTARGPWSELEQSMHINYLEILAAFLETKTFVIFFTITKFYYALTIPPQWPILIEWEAYGTSI